MHQAGERAAEASDQDMEWATSYLVRLVEAYRWLGEFGAARRVLAESAGVADAAGSRNLSARTAAVVLALATERSTDERLGLVGRLG